MECQELVVTPSSKKTNLSNLQYRREGCTAVEWFVGRLGRVFSPEENSTNSSWPLVARCL